MEFGITGSRYLRPDHHAAINDVLFAALPRASAFNIGGAAGVDTFVLRTLSTCREMGTWEGHLRGIVPRDLKWLDEWGHLFDEIVEIPGEYRDRNAEIVRRSAELLAFPLRPEHEQPRSGTWMTIRMGRKAGIPVTVTVLGY